MFFLRAKILIFLVFGTQTILAGDLVLESQPSEADVFVQNLKGSQPIKIGKTPLKMSLSEIQKNVDGSEVFTIIVQKLGFKESKYIVSDISNADLEITTLLESDDILESMKQFDGILATIFDATRMIRMGLYNDAIKKLESRVEDFPLLSTIPELIGTAHLLNKDKKKALAYFDRAVALNPDNVDALKMKNVISASIGAKGPQE